MDKLLGFFLNRAKNPFQEEARPGPPGGFAKDTLDAAAIADFSAIQG